MMGHDNLTQRRSGGTRNSGSTKRGTPECPLVTVVTSVLNGEETLERAINSVMAQSYSNVEYIVVDGGSGNGTIDILNRYSNVIDFWISEPDRGIYDAWNKALKLANGQWIVFLGADDELLPDSIEALVQVAQGAPEPLDFISGMVELRRGGVSLRTIGMPWTWRVFRRYMCVAHVGAMHSAKYFQRYGEFDDTFRIAGDYELLLRAGPDLKAGFAANKVVAHMEVGGLSNQNARVFRETLHARYKNGACTRIGGLLSTAWARCKWRIRRVIYR